MLPVTPATSIFLGVVFSLLGIFGLVVGSNLIGGAFLLVGVVKVVLGIMWGKSLYSDEIQKIRDRPDGQGDRRSDGWDDPWDDGQSDGWDPGRTDGPQAG